MAEDRAGLEAFDLDAVAAVGVIAWLTTRSCPPASRDAGIGHIDRLKPGVILSAKSNLSRSSRSGKRGWRRRIDDLLAEIDAGQRLPNRSLAPFDFR